MKKAGDLLSAFFDRQMLRTAQGYSELFSSWQSIAGEKIACHSWIRELDRSILLIEADHPGWIQILQSKQVEILDRVRSQFPELTITGISFRLGKEGPPSGKKQESAEGTVSLSEVEASGAVEVLSNTPVSPNEEKPGFTKTTTTEAEALERIGDPAFKEALLRLKRGIDARNGKKFTR